MGLFSFIENFFFLSLGILVILIVLLIYHFKQRMSSVEKKGDTMYELLTNVVHEMNILKQANMYYQKMFYGGNQNHENVPSQINIVSKTEPEIDVAIYDTTPLTHNIKFELQNKIIVSDESESGSEYESDSEYESNDENYKEPNYEANSEKSLDLESENSSVYSETSDSEESDHDKDNLVEPEVEDFKHVVEPEVVEPVVEELVVEPVVEPEVELVVEQVVEPEVELVVELVVEPVVEPEVEPEVEPDIEEPIIIIENPISQLEEPRKVDFKKMNIHQLKSAAINYGITSDTSKMKKAELIKLLETKNN